MLDNEKYMCFEEMQKSADFYLYRQVLLVVERRPYLQRIVHGSTMYFPGRERIPAI
jgi:hypothetical protein